MKKIIESIDPVAIAASGLDEAVIAQANITPEKNISELLGETNETENSIGRDGRHHESS